jgi:pyridinium-3,5-biscarboxylic acid mononucleotide synthase
MKKMLEDYKKGKVSLEEILAALHQLPYKDIGCAKVDTHRALRKGFPEAIFCPGKSINQILAITKVFCEEKANAILTKASPEVFTTIQKTFPSALYHPEARFIVLPFGKKPARKRGTVLIITAGTSDIPIAEEAAVTADMMGSRVEKVFDVGVAGVHRLLDIRKQLQEANVVVVVAGMEGALASVVGGLTSKPVIAVPTSVGYGASFSGIAPLLTMLNSCAEGVVVVNIDNGFGAGYFASLINR